MNRLTQKIIKHLLYIKNDDPKFGRFIIGVLFGDQVKRFYEQNKLSNEFGPQRIEFKSFVTSHLVQAESLQKESQPENRGKLKIRDITKLGSEFRPKNINFNYLNKTENGKSDLDSKLGSNQEMNINLKKNVWDSTKKFDNQIVSIDNNNSITINIMNKMNRSNHAEKPTGQNQKFVEPVGASERDFSALDYESAKLNFKTDMSTRFFDLFQNNEFPEDYFDHWVFLQQKLRNYQQQLDDFYLYLYKAKKSEKLGQRFLLRNQAEKFHRKTLLNKPTQNGPFFDQQSLGKRKFSAFDLNNSQKENQHSRNSIFKSMFKPI